MQFKMGADPEFFLYNKENYSYTSAHNIVPGTKKEPYPLKHGALQADGTAVEFNIDAASSAEEFSHNIMEVLKQIREFVPSKYEFRFDPSVDYLPKYFNALPKIATELGCEPDFDAYTKNVTQRNATNDAKPMRTGSGHIHLGWGNDFNINDPYHIWDCQAVVKELDNQFYSMAKVWDCDTRRELLYGKKGCYRPKKYGVEYRVLSNAWLKYPKLYPYLFTTSKNVIEAMSNNKIIASSYDYVFLPQGSLENKSTKVKDSKYLYPPISGYRFSPGFHDFPDLSSKDELKFHSTVVKQETKSNPIGGYLPGVGYIDEVITVKKKAKVKEVKYHEILPDFKPKKKVLKKAAVKKVGVR